MRMQSFRIVLMSAFEPRLLAQLVKRIPEEVPGAEVCGILYERRRPKSFRQRVINFVRHLRDPGYLPYVGARVQGWICSSFRWFGQAGLWFLHAYAPPRNATEFGLKELANFCKDRACTLHLTTDMHAADSLAFVRGLEPDLGIVYGTRILKPALFEIPRLGSINIHKRQLPEYRGGGPIGLWEMLDGKDEIAVTVHRVTARLDAGNIIRSTTIPIEPYDTLRSLALKADVVGADLLVRAVADFATGTVEETPQRGTARSYRTPSPQDLRRYEKTLASQRLIYEDVMRRPTWKLLLRTLGLAPYVAARNWYRRVRGSFPVIVLYHHVVTDRPHPLGIPTDLFYRHLEYLRKYYHVVDLVEALELAKSGAIHAPTVALTFDDGYKDNYVNLRAVTEATGIPVSLFVCTEHVRAQQRFDHDLRLGLNRFMPLTWEQVKHLEASGLRIGSHTRSHFDCRSTDRNRLQSEIAGSRADLEVQLGQPVSCYSFPTGQPANVSPVALHLAKAHYTYVCTTFGKVVWPSAGADPSQVPRCYHPNTLWELELMLQSILEF